MSKIKIEDIIKETERHNWKLISTEYNNLNTNLEFRCDENHTVISSWKKIRDKFECPICNNNPYKNIEFKARQKDKNTIRYLGIDQSTNKSGWCIMDNDKIIYYDVWETKANDLYKLKELREWLYNMIKIWKPDVIGIEDVQYQNNQGAVVYKTLSRLQGVLIELCLEQNIDIEIIHHTKWRSYNHVKGKTRADKKRSMQLIIKSIYDIQVTDDAADAIGITRYLRSIYNKNEIVFW